MPKLKSTYIQCPTCEGSGFGRISEDHPYHLCEDCAGDGKMDPSEFKIYKMKMKRLENESK